LSWARGRGGEGREDDRQEAAEQNRMLVHALHGFSLSPFR
jgi:hypothetical protein